MLKIQYISTPNKLKKDHQFLIRLRDSDSGTSTDIGPVELSGYKTFKEETLPKILESLGYGPDEYTETASISPESMDDHHIRIAENLRDKFEDAIGSGNFNEIFGAKDDLPWYRDVYGNGKFTRKEYHNLNQDEYNLGSDMWKDPVEYNDAAENAAVGEGAAPVKGTSLLELDPTLSRQKSDSSIWDSGAMSEEQRANYLYNLPPSEIKRLLQKRKTSNRWERVPDGEHAGSVLIDLNTGCGAKKGPRSKTGPKYKPGAFQENWKKQEAATEARAANNRAEENEDETIRINKKGSANYPNTRKILEKEADRLNTLKPEENWKVVHDNGDWVLQSRGARNKNRRGFIKNLFKQDEYADLLDGINSDEAIDMIRNTDMDEWDDLQSKPLSSDDRARRIIEAYKKTRMPIDTQNNILRGIGEL